MGEKINPEDQDSNESIKHSHYSNGVPTGREFEHLYEKVDKMDGKLDHVCEFIAGLKQSQIDANRKTQRNSGILSAAIAVIAQVINRAWSIT